MARRMACNYGYLPRIYNAADPRPLLDAYVSQYLKEEVAAEGLARRLPAYADFLALAALADAEVVNYSTLPLLLRGAAVLHRPGGIGIEPTTATPEPRVEQVAHGIAEHVEDVHDNRQAETGPERQPGGYLHVRTSVSAEHPSPARNLGGQTESQEAQGRLGHDHPPTLMLKMTITGAAILGRTCRMIVLHLVLPLASAA